MTSRHNSLSAVRCANAVDDRKPTNTKIRTTEYRTNERFIRFVLALGIGRCQSEQVVHSGVMSFDDETKVFPSGMNE